MDTAQVVGALINRDRFQIAAEITEELFRDSREALEVFNLDQETMLQHALHDVSKLFMAIISHRPALFQKYIEWQRSVFHHRSVPVAVIQQHLEVMERIVLARLEAEHTAIVTPVFAAAYQTLQSIIAPEEPFIRPGSPHADIATGYLADLVAHRAEEAVDRILTAVAEGLPVHSAYLHIIQPVQQEVGRLWQINELSVTEEHYATEASRTLMSRLRGHFSPDTRRDMRVVTACLGGELHDIGARMVNDFLHLGGFETYFTGANTPHHQIIQTIQKTDATVVALSATMTLQVRLALDLIDRIRQEFHRDVRVMVGGYAFNQHESLWKDVGADAYASRADEAVRVIESLAG